MNTTLADGVLYAQVYYFISPFSYLKREIDLLKTRFINIFIYIFLPKKKNFIN